MTTRFPTPSQIAECGGPCYTQGREACDCGLKDYQPLCKWDHNNPLASLQRNSPSRGNTMTTTPDFRAELKKLVDLYYALGGNWFPHGYTDTWNDALANARTALATPPPEPPTDEELSDLWVNYDGIVDLRDFVIVTRAVLERCGHG